MRFLQAVSGHQGQQAAARDFVAIAAAPRTIEARLSLNMTDLFDTISRLVPTLHGWTIPERAAMHAASVLALQPAVTVEIGIFGGRTLLPMALAHKQIGKGVVIGIDPWTPLASVQGQEVDPRHLEYWATCDHEKVMKDFLRHLDLLGVNKYVQVLRKRSDDVEPPAVIDLLHVDGNHGEQALRDAQRFTPKVRVGGLCFVDDPDWPGGGVRKAIQFMESIGFKELFRIDSGIQFQRVSA